MPTARRRRLANGSVTVRIDPKECDDFSSEDSDFDDLGNQGDSECTRSFSGDILVGGQKAGSFSAHLVDRELAVSDFYGACDAESAELIEFGSALFSSSGAPRYPALKSDTSVARGGFLYIDTFKLDAEHRSNGATDVGVAAIRALLEHPDVSHRWTVAAYIADQSAVMSREEIEAETTRLEAELDRASAQTRDEESRRVAASNARMAMDARQFLRAGFAEMAYQQGGWLYLTKLMMQSPPKTHEEALAVPLRLTSAAGVAGAYSASALRAGQTEADKRLLEEAKKLSADCSEKTAVSALLAAVDRLVAEGADPTRAGVLQCCVSNGKKEMLEPMLARGAQINGKDGQTGLTPLMLAAERVPGQVSNVNREHDSTMVATLIALGADKNAVDDDGCSALGYYFKAIRDCNDYYATFSIQGAMQKVDPLLRRMLTPEGGPTATDMKFVDDH